MGDGEVSRFCVLPSLVGVLDVVDVVAVAVVPPCGDGDVVVGIDDDDVDDDDVGGGGGGGGGVRPIIPCNKCTFMLRSAGLKKGNWGICDR